MATKLPPGKFVRSVKKQLTLIVPSKANKRARSSSPSWRSLDLSHGEWSRSVFLFRNANPVNLDYSALMYVRSMYSRIVATTDSLIQLRITHAEVGKVDFELDITKDHTVCLHNAAILMTLTCQFAYIYAHFRIA